MALPNFPELPFVGQFFPVNNTVYACVSVTPEPQWRLVSQADKGLRSELAVSDSMVVIAGKFAKDIADGGGSKLINGVKNLEPKEDVCMTVKGFYADINIGGGDFYYDKTMSWLEHTGGTVIAQGALDAWDGTSNNIATFLNFSGIGVGCYVRVKQTEKLYPEFFGALGNAQMDCTLPIKKTIKVLVEGLFGSDGDPTGEMGFNYGVYRLTESGVFTQVSDNKRAGIKCSGAGPYNTLVWLDPSSFTGDAWFYDNGATSRSWNLTFRDMGFTGGLTWRNLSVEYENFVDRVKGFKFSGPGWESGHVFDNCLFTWLDVIVEAAGSNNADTLRFSNCTAVKCRLANAINNPQSMSITWTQSYLSNHFGSFAEWGAGINGAGDLTFTDGAIIFTPDDYGGRTCYILDMLQGAPTAQNGAINIQGRFELRGVGSKIVRVGNAIGSPIIDFNSSSFMGTSSLNRKLVSIGDYADLNFSKCSFFSTSAIVEFEIISNDRKGKQGTIRFEKTFLDDIEKFSFTFPQGKGFTEIQDCWDKFTEYAGGAVVKSINGVYTGPDLNANLGNRPNKELMINPFNGNALPFRRNNEGVLILPPRVILTRVYIVLPPNAPNSVPQPYRIFVGNDTKTVVYAQLTVANQNEGFVLNQDIAVQLGTTLSERTTRIWADDGSGGDGFAGVCTPLIAKIYYQ